jgi:hypothetical protein
MSFLDRCSSSGTALLLESQVRYAAAASGPTASVRRGRKMVPLIDVREFAQQPETDPGDSETS